MPPRSAGVDSSRRDPRLDLARGLAMFVILVAHTPGNPWALWIPARFGFSDAADAFVFCSGFASALAFGTTFASRGFLLGSARIAHRVWQVYWAHVGVFLVTAALLAAIDAGGWGTPGKLYIAEPYLVPFFEETGAALIGLLTLRYTPGLFDILPMYLVILAMVPAMVAIRRGGGVAAAAAASLALWLAANLAGWSHAAGPEAEGTLADLGRALAILDLPANPLGDGTWFFNPFAWQLVFFAGFALGARWLPAPSRDRRLVRLAALYLIAALPFAWHGIHASLWLPPDWPFAGWIAETRETMRPLIWKTWQGPLRVLHFLALAYLVWFALGPDGRRIEEGFAPRPVRGGVRRRRAALGAALAIATIPYAYIVEIRLLAPALDAWLVETIPLVPDGRIALLRLAHLVGLGFLLWNAASEGARRALLGEVWRRTTPLVRKVGSQSLATFMASIPLAVFCGFLLDLAGRNVLSVAAVNLSGCAVLIAVAYLSSWIKSQPWRALRPAVAQGPQASAPGQ